MKPLLGQLLFPPGAGFRWVKPAASLKLVERVRDVRHGFASFRWVKPAASLKHQEIARVTLRADGVSAG